MVVDAAEEQGDADWMPSVRRAVAGEADSLVIRRLDALDVRRLRALSSALSAVSTGDQSRPLWVAVTLSTGTHSKALLQLLQLFPTTVDLPPLRLHREDVPPLVTLFLSRLSQGRQLSCSPTALRLLMRMDMPGNTRQLHELLREVVNYRRTGWSNPRPPSRGPHGEPAGVQPIEALERDAIVKCLADAHDNKAQAALALGMSRATIYRKIHDYGIVTHAT